MNWRIGFRLNVSSLRNNAVGAEAYLSRGSADRDTGLVLHQLPAVTPEAGSRFGTPLRRAFTIAPALVEPTSRGFGGDECFWIQAIHAVSSGPKKDVPATTSATPEGVRDSCRVDVRRIHSSSQAASTRFRLSSRRRRHAPRQSASTTRCYSMNGRKQ